MSWIKKERDAQKRRENIAKGLTARGQPRKGRAKPIPKPDSKFVVSGGGKRKPAALKGPPRNETHEQRRARGFALRGTPMARDIEARVQKRIEEAGNE
jgi:hypothetical protein